MEKKNIVGYDGSKEPYIDKLNCIIMPDGGQYQGEVAEDPFSSWAIDNSGQIYNIHTLHVFKAGFDTNERADVPEELGPAAAKIKYHTVHSGE